MLDDKLRAKHLFDHGEMPKGIDLLHDPFLNKGTAFTPVERTALGLRGLLPPRIFSQDEQLARILENLRELPTAIEKYIYMMDLQDRNAALFYRAVIDNIEEMMPIIYTPTVGTACLQYGHIFRKPRGLYISSDDRHHIAEILHNWPYADVQVIVVTDGERVLGLGDLGAFGMGIPVGKLALYTACAGVHPTACLPIMLDVGTNNNALRNDPLYFGLNQRRITGQAYNDFMDEFIHAVEEVYPSALIQFEDFATNNAFHLVKKHHNICSFADDIHGTGAVVLAGVYSAQRLTGHKLSDEKFVFAGAGEAAVGAANLIVYALMNEEGLSEEEAREHCWLVDSKGLVVQSRIDLAEHKRLYAHDYDALPTLERAVKVLQPTVLVGVSGQYSIFNREIIEAMADINAQPIVMALSNPTSKSECSAVNAYMWSDGRAIFASGSPYDPVSIDGQHFTPSQANNAYIFPGVGLGVLVSKAVRVTDEMFYVAAKALAERVELDDLATGRIYPPLSTIREVSVDIAAAVAKVAHDRGLAMGQYHHDWHEVIKSQMYKPDYQTYI